MENENFRRKCLQTHGYKFSDHESDTDKSQSDEDLRAMKPPPIPYQDLKNRIVKIDTTKKNSSLEAEIYVNRNTQSCNNLKKKRYKDLATNKTEVEKEKMPFTQVCSKTTNRNGFNSVDKNNVMSLEKSSRLKVTPVLPTVDIQSNNNLIWGGALTSLHGNVSRISPNSIQSKEKTYVLQKSLSNMDNSTKYNSIIQDTTRVVPASYIGEASATRTWDTPNMPNMNNQANCNSIIRHATPTLQVNSVGKRSATKDKQEISNISDRTNYASTTQHVTQACPISYIGEGSTTSSWDRSRTPSMDNQANCNSIIRHATPTLQVNSVGKRSATKDKQEISNISDRANYANIGEGSTANSWGKPKMPNMGNQARTFQANSIGERTTNNVTSRQSIYNSTMQQATGEFPRNDTIEGSTSRIWDNEDRASSSGSCCCCIII